MGEQALYNDITNSTGVVVRVCTAVSVTLSNDPLAFRLDISGTKMGC